ncbi:Carboxylesterase type B [Gemmatirosa kalamazoonensis]|uniref:Carboxylic ester hydrolase n=1 Tax=Gemmatirosa kalamazoonensis TaxID=861299 RepID=W0RGB3_9BACT|nr:carboxylesterase family protein [Gemmatirosa kalamazoonensis]AHG89477.1 Carboxylesterase type B [Gemmatirosa kalamazoonensis]
MTRRFVSTLGVAALAACAHHVESNGPRDVVRDVVRVREGTLRGVVDGGVASFKGVPFAAPPLGELRWHAPRPAAAWSGVRAADRFSPACMQRAPAAFGPWTLEFLLRGPVSEDCLYLNVWTAAPAEGAPRPVLVYVYGGGFASGSSDVPVYDGARLAAKGLVVVTINYRVGALGFLAHPALSAESPDHASGNYGLLDQIAALQWVHDNVAAFGGDPSRVTVAGQSAGAISVFLLTTSPRARGLFQRAVIESGPDALAAMGMATTRAAARPLADAERAGLATARALGTPTVAELRALPAAQLVSPPGAGRFGPVVDGAVVLDALAPINDVPTIAGMNADEGSSAPDYAADTGKARAREVGFESLRRVLAERSTTARTPAYAYYFDRVIPWPEHPEFGAFHTSEVPYVFGTLDVLPRPWTAEDRRLSETMMAYWVNFAARGDPNGPGLPTWPAFAPDGATVLELGPRTGPIAAAPR